MKGWITLIIVFATSYFYANGFQVVPDGPIHEAYAVQESGTIILEAVPNPPPPQITELTSNQLDPQAVWIPGYWAWSRKHGQYLWVSGIWRRPPPGRKWVAGYWKNYPEGWVWIRGLWAEENTHFNFLPGPPPDPIDEHTGAPPSHAADYYWVPGNWFFDVKQNKYVWYSGRWDLFNPEWVYVPAQYIWRESGYVFNPGFWDWPLEDRGRAFAAIYVLPETFDTFVYEPTYVVQELVVMELLFPFWPNYSCLFQYHYYYHNAAWVAWGAVPPWWNWPTWWCYPWQDQWWLWWWWSHPGYPNPPWMDTNRAELIAPPPQFVVKMMGQITPVANVTANGVVGNIPILKALASISGKQLPILPSDPKQIVQIQEVADPQTPPQPYLKPQGKAKVIQAPLKPFFGPSKDSLQTAPQRIKLPPLPIVASTLQKQPVVPQKQPVQPKPQTGTPNFYIPGSAPTPPTGGPHVLHPPQIGPPQPPQKQLPQPYFPTPEAPRTQLPPYTQQPRLQPPGAPTPQAERARGQPSKSQSNLPYPPEWFYKPGVPVNQSPPFNPPYQVPHLPYQYPTQGYQPPVFKQPQPPMGTQSHDFFMGQPLQQKNPPGPKAYQVPGDYSTLPNQ